MNVNIEYNKLIGWVDVANPNDILTDRKLHVLIGENIPIEYAEAFLLHVSELHPVLNEDWNMKTTYPPIKEIKQNFEDFMTERNLWKDLQEKE